MSFVVNIQPSNRQFNIESHESVLDAALRAGVILPYGCKDGACGSCKGKVIQGEFNYKNLAGSQLSEADRQAGYALLCSIHASSDLTLECKEVPGLADFPIKKMPCRVAQVSKIIDDVIVIKLQLPANDKFQFKAGQFIDFILKDGVRRSYSIANAPHEAGFLELHIRHMPGGLFTDHVFSNMKEKDILRFEGPLGTFFLREDNPQSVILLASGTGFAPIKALIEDAIHNNLQRPMTLYWGARKEQDIYMRDLVNTWQTQYPWFNFIPVLSEENWSGRTGFVHQAVLDDHPNLANYQVYACGAPAMVQAAQENFKRQGLAADAFFADAFTSQADQH